MDVSNFVPNDKWGVWTLFCCTSYARKWELVKFNQSSVKGVSHDVVLRYKDSDVVYRTSVVYTSRDYFLAGKLIEDVDLMICWINNANLHTLVTFEMSNPFWFWMDKYVNRLEVSLHAMTNFRTSLAISEPQVLDPDV